MRQTKKLFDNIKITRLVPKNFDREFIKAFNIKGVEQFRKFKSTRHYSVLRGYLFWDPKGLRAKTMVVEEDYYSLSYAGDYKNYYAQCFKPYQKTCKRIHFFNKHVSKKKLEELLNIEEKETELKECYLGSIVVKPLTEGFLGATLLKPYNNKHNRHYTAIRQYEVNLFGKHITIESMAFQEQDQIVANCASSSLWFAFHKTGKMFQSRIPNPSDITLSAGVNFNHAGWFFPSNHLTIEQIGKAINANDMVSTVLVEQEHLQHNKWLKSFMYAFSKTGIPVLLGLKIEKEELGHMVTINGYRFIDTKKFPEPVAQYKPGSETAPQSRDEKKQSIDLARLNSLKLFSDNIIKFYAHDDQTGPFTSFEFIPEQSRKPDQGNATEGNEVPRFQFKTTGFDKKRKVPLYEAYASTVIIPLAKSILLPYQSVIAETARLNAAMIDYWKKNNYPFDFVWDVYLDSSKMYKKDIRSLIKKQGVDENAAKLLYKAMPEYVWVVRCILVVDGEFPFLAFDILYDASDLDVHTIYYTNFYHAEFKGLMDKYKLIKNENNKETIFYPSSKNPVY